jgi:hypothetical protein
MTIEEMITELAGLFPSYFKDQTKIEGRIAHYRKSLGHLKPDRLGQAFDDTMRNWTRDKPPMAADIRDNIKSMDLNDPEGFNFKRMNDALPGIIADIKASWWRINGGWVDRLVEEFQRANPGHDEAVAAEIRMRVKDCVNTRSHTYAQRVYRGAVAVPDFRLEDSDVNRVICKPGPLDPYVIAIREGREPPRLRQLASRKSRAA